MANIIARLYDFVAGQKIYSAQIDAEFNQLVDAHNTAESNLDSRFTNYYSKNDTDNKFATNTRVDQIITTPISGAAATQEVVDARGTYASVGARLDDTIGTGTKITPSVVLGMNNVIRKTQGLESIPTIAMTGKSCVNLLGKDGNCEDISKWTNTACTLALDSTNKVFGANGIKATLTTTAGNFKINLIGLMDASKYYMVSMYLKNGNATNVLGYLYTNGTGKTAKPTATITSTSAFTRVIAKMQPSDWGTGSTRCDVEIDLNGANTQYAYVDGVMVTEISASDYSLTDAQLMDKYPYIDSYACLQNPYIEVRHDNLVRNGNAEEGIGWWIPGNTSQTFTTTGAGFRLTSTSGAQWLTQSVAVKPNTNYYLTSNAIPGTATGNVYVKDSTNTTILATTTGAFNSGSNTTVIIQIAVLGVGYADFASIMLIEGTSAPSSYKPCRIERCVIEGKFTSDDTVTLENGEVTGLQWWKHRTLFGKDYDWSYVADYAGFKSIQLAGLQPLGINGTNVSNTCIKYDGKVMLPWNATNSADRHWHDANPATIYYLTVADTDSGWAETINPNNDEAKAFMNGWKTDKNNGTRYTRWVSIVDSTMPKALALATVSASTNTTAITVSSGGTAFVSGDLITLTNSSGTVYYDATVTGTPTATNIPITTTVPATTGYLVFKNDNGTTNTTLLNYCKNNVAPGYEGYQLHYKLANPEPITGANVHIHGDIPKFDLGDNYLYLDYGMVLGEIASPQYDGTTNYCINSTGAGFTVQPYLKSKVEAINSIYKNQIGNTAVWTIRTAYYAAAGNQDAYTIAANFDTNATYTVDYQILKTMHTTPAAITMEYYQSILNVVNDLSEAVENKQNKDSALDNLIDLSMYEDISHAGSYAFNWYCAYNMIYVEFHVPFKIMKKVTPVVSVTPVIAKGTAAAAPVDITSKFSIASMSIGKSGVYITYSTSDATSISDIKTYGILTTLRVVADCRGRV